MSNFSGHLDRNDAAAPLGRRERKKLVTRDRILDCAIDLFSTRGYEATTMEDIGECADVSRATVFNYFDRKEDILLAWLAGRRAYITQVLAEAEEQGMDTPSRLRRVLGALADLNESDPARGRTLMRSWLRAGGALLPDASRTALLLAETIRFGQRHRDIRTDIDPLRAGELILDGYVGILGRWAVDDEGKVPLRENLMAMLDLALPGLTTNS